MLGGGTVAGNALTPTGVRRQAKHESHQASHLADEEVDAILQTLASHRLDPSSVQLIEAIGCVQVARSGAGGEVTFNPTPTIHTQRGPSVNRLPRLAVVRGRRHGAAGLRQGCQDQPGHGTRRLSPRGEGAEGHFARGGGATDLVSQAACLAQLKHKQIAKFYGLVYGQDPLMVLHLYPGTVLQYLQQEGSNLDPLQSVEDNVGARSMHG